MTSSTNYDVTEKLSDATALEDVTARVDEHLKRAVALGKDAAPAVPNVARYDAKGELARGGMGRVLLADDNALARPVAMKVLHEGSDDELRRRFAREAGIASRLEHPCIVPLYDAGVDEKGNPFLTMRYVEGETLKPIIERMRAGDEATLRAWPLERRCRIVMQLLGALSLAHQRGVLHRDIKPANVMIGPFGEVLLVDWGLACTPQESVGDVIGTIAYMSPEQADAEQLDARSDIYSLSVLLYELLTLRHPLGDVVKLNTVAALLSIIDDNRAPIVAPEFLRVPGQPVVPRALSLIVMKGLDRDRNRRWPSASSMEDAIQRFLAGDAAVVCPHTAYARGLSLAGRALDAWPRTIIFGTALVGALAAWGALDVVMAVKDVFGR